MASCTFKGAYHLITEVYAAVVAWLDANGYESADPMFNIYHVSPHETRDPDEFVTEVCYPVKRKYPQKNNTKLTRRRSNEQLHPFSQKRQGAIFIYNFIKAYAYNTDCHSVFCI